MKKILLFLLVFIIGLGSATAQTFNGVLNPFPAKSAQAVDDTVKILAVMAEFQTDKDETTFGDGTFGSIYSENVRNRTDIIDPLPHDKEYFEKHLEFAANYYRKVSNGKTIVEFTILENIVTLDQTMRFYSPDPGSEDFLPLGNFAEEVWAKTAQAYAGQTFSGYDLFAVFHAGVGRDLSLPGSLGNERDLPSVYLSSEALKEFFGENFTGFELGGNNIVSNTMILPETESRELESAVGTALLELSINGLIVSSIASHLGLPDLFDTETGLSAIGRFGLMDGQAIFAYNGLFPPQPNVWEKIFLGWVEPVVLEAGDYTPELVTAVAAGIQDTSYIKVPINDSEYFLVENRQRDALNNGAVVTYFSEGEYRTGVYEKDTTGFYSYDIDTLQGVVTDVDEFDWAVPGSGILVWHIDEKVINENLAENRINVTKDHRGVDLEEADGIQEIGEQFNTITGDVVIGEGTEEDLFYKGNPARLYSNAFTKNTQPSSDSYSGASSLIAMTDFPESSNRMRFKVSTNEYEIKLLTNRNLEGRYNSKFAVSSFRGVPQFFIQPEGSAFRKYSLSGGLLNDTEYRVVNPVVYSEDNFEIVAGISALNENIINVYLSDGNVVNQTSVVVGERLTAEPYIYDVESSVVSLKAGSSEGTLYTFSVDKNVDGAVSAVDSLKTVNSEVKKLSVAPDGFAIVAGDQNIWLNGGMIPVGEPGKMIIAGFNGENYTVVRSLRDNSILTYKGSDATLLSSLETEGDFIILPPGEFDPLPLIAVASGSELKVYQLNGAPVDNFPFESFEGSEFSRYLSASFLPAIPASKANTEYYQRTLYGNTKAGNYYAVNIDNAETVNPFPLAVSDSVAFTRMVNGGENDYLVSFSEDGRLMVWQTPDRGFIYSNVSAEAPYFDFGFAQPGADREYFPESRAYNYPNPVYDKETFIRFYVSEDSNVKVKIFDAAGALVEELSMRASGGYDSEISWNVENIESGVYFARLTADSDSGMSSGKTIKIAVVK